MKTSISALILAFLIPLIGAGQITVSDQTYCSPDDVTFTSTDPGCANFEWYNEKGYLVGVGCNFNTGIIGFDQKYKVKDPSTEVTKSVSYKHNAASLNTFGPHADWFPDETYKYSVIFDAKVDFTLDSVTIVYNAINAAGCDNGVSLELRDNKNITVRSMTVPTECGAGQKITRFKVGFDIPTGNSYRLVLKDRTTTEFVRGNLIYFHKGGVNYGSSGPLNYNELYIKGNMGNPGWYRGIYDWKIITKGEKDITAIDNCGDANCETEGDPIVHIDFGTGAGARTALDPTVTTYLHRNIIINPDGTVSWFNRPDDGQYTITNYNRLNYIYNVDDWTYPGDHTNNDAEGNYFLVNAEFTPGEFYRTSVNGLCPNSFYTFSAYLVNILRKPFCDHDQKPINVKFQIENFAGDTLLREYTTGDIYNDVAQTWTKYSFKFFTGNLTDIQLVLINNGPGGCGNDLAIDDITFSYCGPDLTITSNVPLDTGVCIGDPLVFSSDLGTGLADPEYQWQRSVDGYIWDDMIGETESHLDLLVEDDFTMHYRVVAASQGNMDELNCRITSNILTVIPTDCGLPVTFTSVKAFDYDAGSNKVLWQVALEKEIEYYIVEKSIDGFNFTLLQEVPAAGFKTYFVNDLNPWPKTYYRITAVELDGDEIRSYIFYNQKGTQSLKVEVFPVPVTTELNVLIPEGVFCQKYFISDLTGKIMLEEEVNREGEITSINVDGFSSGIYLIHIITETGVASHRFIKSGYGTN